jgi:hypothetical protein
MSIRIRRAMGWGIVLPNSSYDQLVNEKKLDKIAEGEKTIKQYYKWLCQKYGVTTDASTEDFMNLIRPGSEFAHELFILRANKERRKKLDITSVCHSIEVSDDMKALLLAPVFQADSWYRFDDDMDYSMVLEKAEPNSETVTEVLPLKYNPHPYDGVYMDSITGEPWSKKLTDAFRVWERAAESGYSHPFDPERVTAFLKESGYDSFEHAQQSKAPNVPPELRNFVEWSGVLQEPADLFRFRPMIITWWG